MESIGKIAVIIPQISSNSDTEFIDPIHSTAVKFGYDTIVISSVIDYLDQHLDLSYSKGQTNIFDLLRRRDIPCVAVNYEQPYFPVISANEETQLYLSSMHLIKEHNCKKYTA